MSTRKPADERKAEIVAAMLRLADELGPDRLTTQTVADAVGLTQPAISSDPRDRIEGLVLVQLRQIEAMPAIPSILFSRELQAENDELRQSVLALMTKLVTTLTDELGKSQKAGAFRSDLAAKDGAYLLVSLVQGLAIRWTLGKRGFGLEAEGRRLLTTQLQLFQSARAEEVVK